MQPLNTGINFKHMQKNMVYLHDTHVGFEH